MSIIDEHTRECLTSLVERSVTADALIDELDRLALTRGYPAVLRCDNGPELACEAMADWAGEHVALSFIPPGEPWRNGYVESFNGRVRDECLHCTGKAHRREHLGYAGRRVLVSRKWSGKTLADHRGDRKAWLLATLGLPADDPCQYHWERVNPGDRDHMPPGRRLLHVLTDRAR